MKHHMGPPVLPDAPSQTERVKGTLLGWYTTADGRRHLRAIETNDYGLCIVDEGSDAAFLVEPLLEDFDEARAIAADYLACASEQGRPQTRHSWPPSGDAQKRSES
jgi:hypothetical protein